MEAKEKAEELVEKFRKYVNDGRHNGFYSGEITFENQKQCALTAVDEILNIDNIKPYILHKEIIEFYKEVKTEINKL